MADNDPKIIILGAGLSGLGAAYHSSFPVYEALGEPGGIAASISKNGYVFDFGIHVLHSKAPWFHEMMSVLKIEFVRHLRKALIFSFGAYAAYPFQVNTSHLPIGVRLRCVLGYLSSVFLQTRTPPKTYEEWIRQNFGSGFAEKFLIPYSAKFWGVPPKEMTYEWTGQQRVPRPKIIDVIKGAFADQEGAFGPNDQFRYPSKPGVGFGEIARSLAERCKRVHYGMKATTLDPDKKVVFFNEENTPVEYDRLISTIPLPELVKLIQNPPREVQSAVDRLRFNSIIIVNLGINRRRINPSHWIHFPDPDISFFRISFPSNFCPGLNPEETSTIQAEISYNHQNPPDRDMVLKRVKKDLIDTGVIRSDDKIIFQDVMSITHGYVIYDFYRKEAVRTIHDYLNKKDIFPCGRYGCWEYQWADEAVLSGKEMVEKLRKQESLI